MTDTTKGICRYCGAPIANVPAAKRQFTWYHIDDQDRTRIGHHAQPMIIQQERLLQLKAQLNSLPAAGQYGFSEKLVRMVIAEIDKTIGRDRRLIFLCWVFERPVRTSKLNREKQITKTTIMNGDQPQLIFGYPAVEVGEIEAVTDGLEPNEAMSILRWAGPAKLTEEGPWTFAPIFRQDLRLLNLHIAQQMSFLSDEKKPEQP